MIFSGPPPLISTMSSVYLGIIRFSEIVRTGQNVFDLDSMQLLQTVRHMRDNGKFISGDDIKRPPAMFVGAAANPFAEPFRDTSAQTGKENWSRCGVHPDTVHL